MGKLDGKVAIVTGGASGMGEAAVRLFVLEGASVVIADCIAHEGDEARVETMIKELKAAGGNATFAKVDVSKAADAQRMVRTAVDNYGKLDILFNNAGIQGSYDINTADYPEDLADKVLAVNFKGVFLGTKYAIPEMIKAGGGSIVHTASICAFSGLTGMSIYNATKGAVVAFSHSVATEYADQKIRSNTVNTSPAQTPLHTKFSSDNPELWKAVAKTVPLGRVAVGEDIAKAALFLASDDAEFITGADLMVDGGWRIRGFGDIGGFGKE